MALLLNRYPPDDTFCYAGIPRWPPVIAHICNSLVIQASLNHATLSRERMATEGPFAHVPKKLIDFFESACFNS